MLAGVLLLVALACESRQAPGPEPTARSAEGPVGGPPCFEGRVPECLAADDVLKAPQGSERACDKPGPRVCIVVLGGVPGWQVDELRTYLSGSYGVDVRVLAAIDLPAAILGPGGSQLDASEAAMFVLSSASGLPLAEEVSYLILTPVDLWSGSAGAWVLGVDNPAPSHLFRYAVVSTFRMNPVTFGGKADDTLWMARIRKLSLRYVGLLHFRLEESDDPSSILFRGISDIRSLDAAGDTLSLKR